MSAEERLKRIKKSIRGKDSYSAYTEHRIMKEYSISYGDLMDFPYEKYLEFSKIISEEKKHEKKEQQSQKKKMDNKL